MDGSKNESDDPTQLGRSTDLIVFGNKCWRPSQDRPSSVTQTCPLTLSDPLLVFRLYLS